MTQQYHMLVIVGHAMGSSIRFQSMHPHGVRRIGFRYAANALMFQSTHPHGVRLYKYI